MGVPYFQIANQVKKNKIFVFSSNFKLYGDMSKRVMNILKSAAPTVEIYSIDEAFLDLSHFSENVSHYAENLVKQIYQWTGLPVSIGIAPTKTLAKAANFAAKKQKTSTNICHLLDTQFQIEQLAQMQVKDIWGIGRRTSEKLNQIGIHTALQLRNTRIEFARRHFNICLVDTILELQGKGIKWLETESKPRKQIIVSRSFGKKVNELGDLKAALTDHICHAASKLRQQGSTTKTIFIFLKTHSFKDHHGQKSTDEHSITIPLETPTDNSTELISIALQQLNTWYRHDFFYKKIGIMLLDLKPKENLQYDLFSPHDYQRSQKLMDTLDSINSILGRGTLRYGIQIFKKTWSARCTHRSQSYTTDWHELLCVS